MTTYQTAKIEDIRNTQLGNSKMEAVSTIELIATLYEFEEDPAVKEEFRIKLQQILEFMVDKIDWKRLEG